MIEEIKEILDKLKKTADTSFFAICYSQEELDKLPKGVSNFLTLNDKQSKLLLDYITNLKKLKERYQLKKEVYKSRIDKAIEFVDWSLPCIHDEEILNDLLNILKGDSDE